MTTETFRVPDVSCEHCVRAITQELSGVAGVQQVQVSIDDKLVTVEHSGVASSAIVAAIHEAGYDEVEQLAS